MYHVSTMHHEVWEEAVRRVADSQTLRHRAALRRLFLYLTRKALNGAEGDFKEYVIGVEACAKPAGYDTQTDASVRVQVSRLRQSLIDYYARECPNDPVLIEIPKGQFLPVFRLLNPDVQTVKNAAEVESAEPAASDVPPPDDRQRTFHRLGWAAMGLGIVILTAGMLSVSLLPGRNSRKGAPVLRAELIPIWQKYVDEDRSVLIVLGTPLFAKFTTSETGVFFRDPRLNEWEGANGSADLSKVSAAVGGVHVTPSRIYTGVGEAMGAFQLSRVLSQTKGEVSLRRSHSLGWDDLKDRNIIVLGAPKHNLQLASLPIDEQFHFYRGSIRNLHPRSGEPELFDPSFSRGYGEIEEDHALISRFPGLHGLGQITVLAGSSTEATLAAVEYTTQPRYAADLLARLRDSKGGLPPAFQVVVKAKFKSQTSVEIRYVTHRILNHPVLAGNRP